jgi:amyloid beta precursor protein binding protein 1
MATTNKYDRQLRLWGSNGQKALSESCIILINASSAGTETLKNLVLPGIGSFHIIDDQHVSMDNANKPFCNFFVFPDETRESDDCEKVTQTSRAQIATKHLLELNPDVKGSHTHVPSLDSADYESIFQSIRKENGCGWDNLLVVVADLPSKILIPISNLCWNGTVDSHKKSIPLVIVKSYGLIGIVRIQTPFHTIIESKPDNSIPDMRLAAMSYQLAEDMNTKKKNSTSTSSVFLKLLEYIQSIDIESLENHEHGHIPFVPILFKAMEKWLAKKKENNDACCPPQTFAEKQEFKQLIQSMARNYNMELNFQEAVDNASLAYAKLDLPCEVEELLALTEEKVKLTMDEKSLTSFDTMVTALKTFMDSHYGFPPLNGSIPDMTASTSHYIELQNIYKTKAQSDMDEMKNLIQSLHDVKGDGITFPQVSDDELSIFCKNIYNLRLTKTRSFSDEYQFVYSSDGQKQEILGELVAESFDPYAAAPQTPMLWFLALRAADAFYDECGYYPGKDSRVLALDSDAKIVQEKLKMVVDKMGLSDNELIASTLFSTEEDMKNAFAEEVTRYYNAEVHNISSVVGGVASQEAVKLITKQYLPMHGTYIYNGIAGVPGIYQF